MQSMIGLVPWCRLNPDAEDEEEAEPEVKEESADEDSQEVNNAGYTVIRPAGYPVSD